MQRTVPSILAVALAAAAAHAGLPTEDLRTLATPGHPSLDADGKRFVFAVTEVLDAVPRSGIWYFDPGGPKIRQRLSKLMGFRDKVDRVYARPLTGALGDAHSPAFTPDGTQVSFLARRGAGGHEQVWVLPLDGGEAVPWTDSPGDVELHAWDESGDLFYVTRAAGQAEVRQVPPGDSEETVRFRHDGSVTDISASTDGSRLVIGTVESDGTGRGTVWAAGSGAALRRIDPEADAVRPAYYEPAGAAVYGVRRAGRTDELRLASLEDGTVRPLTEFPEGTIREIRTGPRTTRIYVVVGTDAGSRLARVIVDNGRVEYLTPEGGRVRDLTVKADGERTAFVWETPEQAPEIATWAFPDTYVEVRTARNEGLTALAAAQDLSLNWTAAYTKLMQRDPAPVSVRDARAVRAIGPDAPEGGFLVVDLNLPRGAEKRRLQLTGDDADVTLEEPDGGRRPPVGIPVAWSGQDRLLRGAQTALLDGGAVRVAFERGALMPPVWLHALDYPPVEIRWENPEATEDGDS